MTELEAARIDEAVTLASQHVGIRGHKVDAFLRTLKMCGYELAPLPCDQANAPATTTADEPAPRVGDASVSLDID